VLSFLHGEEREVGSFSATFALFFTLP